MIDLIMETYDEYCNNCNGPLDEDGFCRYCYQTMRLEDDSE